MATRAHKSPAAVLRAGDRESLSDQSSMRHIAYWESTLFSSVYLRNDIKRDFAEKWGREFDDAVFDKDGNTVQRGFYHFYNEFRNIAKTLRAHTNKKLSETDTINKVIAPVLNALGWYDKCSNNAEEPFAAETSFSVKASPKNKTFRTDLILVDAPQEANFISGTEDSEKRKREARQYCIVPLEAKYWNRISEREKSNIAEDSKRADRDADDTGASLSFNEQTLNYMSILHSKWGVVTDGSIWRLLNTDISGESPSRSFEFKLESLIAQEEKIAEGSSDEAEFLENAKFFYLFFGKSSFVKDETGKVFVDEVLRESRKYIDSIEEDLKDRFISAMNIMCDGLLKAAQKSGTFKKPTDDDLRTIRTVAESHLFNILFIRSCEARSILPIKAPNYYVISLTSVFDRISLFEPEKYGSESERDYLDKKLAVSLKPHGYSPGGTILYRNLIRLTEAIHDGASKDDFGFEIKGFKESVFTNGEWTFAKDHSLSDREMVQVFFELGYSKAILSGQRNYQQIPYNYFTPRQLGSIYESFLEFKLEVAKEPMVYLQKRTKKKTVHQWVKLTAAVQRQLKGHEPRVKPGQVFFTPNNADRKSSGSYYTPDYIVQFIVSRVLGPLCKAKTSEQILNLKVCDPAMGSGHFLLGALDFLTGEYLRALELEVPASEIPSREEAKRVVLDRCIFGVDINPRAVKLAKMSLWLESAHWGKKLERLDDQLLPTDTLESEKIWSKYPELNKSGFDAIVGNPPYLKEANNKKIFDKIRTGRMGPYCTGRMDLWYLFGIVSLDLLKNGGRQGFIAPNTWIGSEGATQLRAKIRKDADVETYINFGDFKVFKDASIQTMIYIAVKNKSGLSKPAKYFNFKGADLEEEGVNRSLCSLKDDDFLEASLTSDSPEAPFVFVDTGLDSIFGKIESCGTRRLTNKEIGNGIDVLQDFVSKSHLPNLKSGDIKVGDGIFVLTNDEKRSMELSASDLRKIKPYYTSSELDRFLSKEKNQYWIIYADEEVRNNIRKFPGIKAHLDKFKPVLTSAFAPYGLNRPREEQLFTGNAIYSVRKTRKPAFAFAEHSAYVSRGYMVIKPENWQESCEYLVALLNSKLMYCWFFNQGKKQGDQLQMDKEPLMAAPLKTINFKDGNERKIHDRITGISKTVSTILNKNPDADVSDHEQALDKLVYDLYGLSISEVKRLEATLPPEKLTGSKASVKKAS